MTSWNERICRDCLKPTAEARFATFKNRDGSTGRRSVCKDCRGAYAKQHVEQLRQYRKDYNVRNRTKKQERDAERKLEIRELVDQHKDRPCADCGEKWPPVAMDLDHVGDDKIMSVSQMVGSGYRWNLIKSEVAKCEVVCACCHRLRTQKRGENLAPNSKKT